MGMDLLQMFPDIYTGNNLA